MPNDYSPSGTHRSIPKFLIIGIIVVLIGGAVFYFFKSRNQGADKTEEPQTTVQVQTETLQKKMLDDTVQAFGMLQPDLGAADTMSFSIPVQIKRLLVTPGQFVQAGQPLFEVSIDPAAEVIYQQAVTAESLARDELNRTETMLGQQLATQSQVATARKALQDAEVLLKAQHRMQAEIKGGIFHAAHGGLVASLTAQQGDRLQPGTAILQLSQSAKLIAQLSLMPEVAQRVKPGMAVQITSLFDDAVTIDGVVVQVMGAIDPKTRMVDVITRLKSVPAKALPGTQIQGNITISGSEQWVVARSAVLTDEKGISYIYQVDGDHARRLEVKPGLENGDEIGITPTGKQHFDPKMKVVVSGNYELKDGAALKEAKEESKEAASETAAHEAAAEPAAGVDAAKKGEKAEVKPEAKQ